MRVLFVTETTPYPLDSGGRIKTWHTLRVLGRRHEVHLHAFIRHERERDAEPALRAHVASVTWHLVPPGTGRELRAAWRSLTRGLPFTVARHWQHAAASAIALAAARLAPDVAYADHLSMLQYVDGLDLPIVHDAHNVEFEIVRRYATTAGVLKRALAGIEWRRLRAYERHAYDRCAVVTVVSSRDADHMRALGVTRPALHIVPIAFDLKEASHVAEPPRSGGVAGRPSDPPSPRSARASAQAAIALFVGGLHWPPNAQAMAWCVREIWPLVVQAHPEAELVIVGRASEAQRRVLEQAPRVRVVGYVDDVAPWFGEARAFVIPLQSGGGMRVKMLEAFARGTPVVATRVGAEGIEASEPETWLEADEPAAFAAAVVRVLSDDATAEGLRARGRRLVEARYSVEAIATALEGALASIRKTDSRAP